MTTDSVTTEPAAPAGVPLEHAVALSGTAGRFSARLSPAWGIWGPNGGYLATVALLAAGRCAEIPSPAGVHATFLRSPRFDEVELDVVALKRGRRAETFAVTMTQDGNPVLVATVRTAASAPGYENQPATAPAVPAPGDLPVTASDPRIRFWDNIERRTAGDPGPGRLVEWLRFRPQPRFADPFLDAARSLILIDTYGWPTVHRTLGDGPWIAPNFDVAAWFYPAAEPTDWLLSDAEYQIGQAGRLGVAGKVYDEAGRLIATGAGQLCCMPKPPGLLD